MWPSDLWFPQLAQLLESHVDHKSRGIYAELNFLRNTTPQEREEIYGAQILHDFKLDSVPYYEELGLRRDPARMLLPAWDQRLKMKGVRDDDLFFLHWVLNPDPTTRPTWAETWNSGWLDFGPSDADNGSCVVWKLKDHVKDSI